MSGVEGKKRAKLERWLRERELCGSTEQYRWLVTATLAALSELEHHESGDLEDVRLSLDRLSKLVKPVIGSIKSLKPHVLQRLQWYFFAHHKVAPGVTKSRILDAQETLETLTWIVGAAEDARQLKKSTSETDTRGIIDDVGFVASAWELHARKRPSWSRKGHFAQYLREAGFYVKGRNGAKKHLAEETLRKAVEKTRSSRSILKR